MAWFTHNNKPVIDLWNTLPDDIYRHIILKVKYDGILQMSRVSHKCKNIIHDTNFWRDKAMHDFSLSLETWNQNLAKTGNYQYVKNFLPGENLYYDLIVNQT